jgi:hypothetical protein
MIHHHLTITHHKWLPLIITQPSGVLVSFIAGGGP